MSEQSEPAVDLEAEPAQQEPLPDWGRQALEKANREAAGYRKKLRELEPIARRAQEAQDATKSELERAVEQARRETAETTRRETASEATVAVLKAKIEAAAGTKLADPSDAVRLLDLSSFEVGDGYSVDRKAVDAAIDALLVDKPYLAARGNRPRGDIDLGPRQSAPATDMNSVIRRQAGIS